MPRLPSNRVRLDQARRFTSYTVYLIESPADQQLPLASVLDRLNGIAWAGRTRRSWRADLTCLEWLELGWFGGMVDRGELEE
jgi:hypothetical protein